MLFFVMPVSFWRRPISATATRREPMHLKPTKLIFGGLLATSLGFFAIPAHASLSSALTPKGQMTANTNTVVAGELEDKAQGKVNEMHDAASGAANAVEEKHEEHEAAENTSHHHGLKHKAKSKMNEVKGEASGAAGAVDKAHQEHEQAEHE
jgi:hypothetical protein